MKVFLAKTIGERIRRLHRQPLVQRLRHRYPKAFAFVLNRFDAGSFLGLPLTLMLAAGAFNVMLLSELTEDVLESEGIVQLDHSFTALLYSARSGWLSQFFYIVTQLGAREAVFILGGILTLPFFFRKRYLAVVAFWLTMAGVGLSVQEGKKLISRDRPEEVGFYTERNHSFPSGHATTSMALYGTLAYLMWRYGKSGRKYKRLYLALATLLIALVGFSRIYLGVHFLSDVLAGYLLGFLWVLLGISLVEAGSLRRAGNSKKTM